MSGLILLFIGIRDDAKEMSPWIRLLSQASSAIISLYFLGGINEVDLGFYVWESPLILNIVAFFTFLWFINLFNFYDGIDGNLGSQAIAICVISLAIVPYNPLVFLIACVGGFLKLNWQKAKIFMGNAYRSVFG